MHSVRTLTSSGGRMVVPSLCSTTSPHAYCSVSRPSLVATSTSLATGLRTPAGKRRERTARLRPVFTQTPEPAAGRMKQPGGWCVQSQRGSSSRPKSRICTIVEQLGGCIPSSNPIGRWSIRITSTQVWSGKVARPTLSETICVARSDGAASPRGSHWTVERLPWVTALCVRGARKASQVVFGQWCCHGSAQSRKGDCACGQRARHAAVLW
mmetsp:Transcript_49063/g.162445  ORF Transcript_49063/g.162445 Transcript_49063/m.162445 type:complete len:211 (+) Transcript_49063:1802-2434(+)